MCVDNTHKNIDMILGVISSTKRSKLGYAGHGKFEKDDQAEDKVEDAKVVLISLRMSDFGYNPKRRRAESFRDNGDITVDIDGSNSGLEVSTIDRHTVVVDYGYSAARHRLLHRLGLAESPEQKSDTGYSRKTADHELEHRLCHLCDRRDLVSWRTKYFTD